MQDGISSKALPRTALQKIYFIKKSSEEQSIEFGLSKLKKQ